MANGGEETWTNGREWERIVVFKSNLMMDIN